MAQLDGNTSRDDAYTVIQEDQQYSGNIFDVVALRVKGPDGIHIDRDVVRHAPVVFILAHRNDTDAYLTERQWRPGTRHMDMELPAGFIEKGEAPSDAAMRELKEETGLDLKASHAEMRSFGPNAYSSPGFTDERAYLFSVELDRPVMGSQNLDADEHLTFTWTDADDLYKHLTSGDVPSAVAQSMLYHEFLKRLNNDDNDTGTNQNS